MGLNVPQIPTPPVISLQIVLLNAKESTFFSVDTTTSISSSSISIYLSEIVTICQFDYKIMMVKVNLAQFMPDQILVTGFEPFGSHTTNVSSIVANELQGKMIRGHEIVSIVLPVDEEGTKKVANMNEKNNFKAILHIGLAESAIRPRIELRAKDSLNFKIPDNSGRMVKYGVISGKGDLFSTVDIDDWDIESMIDQPEKSNDAGDFICNETLYRTLENLDNDIPCCFLHIPLRQTDAIGLALECLDRMLRPACIDVGAGAIISQGKFLAARRAPSEKHAGWWEFPGGKFEHGEDASSCLIREIKEELDLDITVHDEIGKWIFDHGDVVVRLHVMICKIISGDMKLSVHDKILWCSGPDQVEWLGPDREIALAISAKLPHQH